jgi:hypothetical protein
MLRQFLQGTVNGTEFFPKTAEIVRIECRNVAKVVNVPLETLKDFDLVITVTLTCLCI